MSTLLRREAQTSVATSPQDEEMSMSNQLDRETNPLDIEIVSRHVQRPAPRRPGKLSAFAVLAAVMLLVALMGVTLRALSLERQVGPAAAGQWSDVAQFTMSNNAFPTIFVAPSNPNVIYEAVSSTATNYTLRRSDDHGTTWVSLRQPTTDGRVWVGDLFTSPLDPLVVFLSLIGDPSVPGCPALSPTPAQEGSSQGTPTPGGYSCSLQFMSRDGGMHWSRPIFPLPEQHFTGGLGPTTAMLAQGTQLYATIIGDGSGAMPYVSRLVASDDGGTTWSLVDGGLQAEDASIVSYCVIPTSTTLYATTLPQGTTTLTATPATKGTPPSTVTPPPTLLWRSDDAGLHWSRVGTLAQTQMQLIGAGMSSHEVLLYAAVLEGSSPMQGIRVSTDGGVTWQAAPSAGIPAGLLPVLFPPAGTLADGSLVLGFVAGPTAVAATAVTEKNPPTNQPPAQVTVTVVPPVESETAVATARSTGSAGSATPPGDQQSSATQASGQPGGESNVDDNDVTYLSWRPGDSNWVQVAPKTGTNKIIEAWIAVAASKPQTFWIVCIMPDNTTITLRKYVLA
jgi:hypothetical protein